LLEIAFWRPEASTSYQGLSINSVNKFLYHVHGLVLKNFSGTLIYGCSLVGRECLSPLKSYFQQPYQVWWYRIKRMLSSGSGKKRGLHFDDSAPVAKDLIRKLINKIFTIILNKIWKFLKYPLVQNLENCLLARWQKRGRLGF
jgi:hypothetical protein